MNQLLKEMLGNLGGYLLTGTDAHEADYKAMIINTDAVISEFFVDGVDVCTARGFATKTLSAGMYLHAGFNYTSGVPATITKVKLTSGSVILY